MTTLRIPELSLVVLIGPSGAGKSTFARRHFRSTEVLSSDFFRGMVADDENSLAATPDAFAALHFVAERRLAAGRLTVIDATSVRPEDRKSLLALARQHHMVPVAIVLDLPVSVCIAHNERRPDRQGSARWIVPQHAQMRRGIRGRGLEKEGFRHVFFVSSEEEATELRVERTRMWPDRREERGPFDIVGDVHGCWDELVALLDRLGWRPDPEAGFRHPDGRKLVFVGDLVDRGPRNLDCLDLCRRMCTAGVAIAVPGNHEAKLLDHFRGKAVKPNHGREATFAELAALSDAERAAFIERHQAFIEGLVSHVVLDDGRLVVAHAGLKAEMHNRASGTVRSFCLYGDTTGEIDEYGVPVRLDWAQSYRGSAAVVHGHVPVLDAAWVNNTLDLDTGCVFGGQLSALRWPEREIVSVPAAKVYFAPSKPVPARNPEPGPDPLDLGDVTGRRVIETRLVGPVRIGEEQMAAAIELMSRFGADPRWIVHLPPTMSPSETSARDDLLEHPDEAFAYYVSQGITQLVCEEKHMGSRAIVAVCRDAAAARRRFGVEDGTDGAVLTRTGRPFFGRELTDALLDRLRAAMDRAGFWETHATDWALIDAELLPWSAKAQDLLQTTYAPVGVAAAGALGDRVRALEQAAAAGRDVGGLLDAARARLAATRGYQAAWRGYAWPVASVDDLRLAPFHLLATEHGTGFAQDHAWHLAQLAPLAGGVVLATRHRFVDLTAPGDAQAAVDWWTSLVEAGGEGMVVKPLNYLNQHDGKQVQPAIKCRGPEYLRIIYGPEYRLPAHLERLRKRAVASKRRLAVKELALGVEAVERFVRREPLRQVHACVLGVLAMEAEPIDPRL